jgi:hypothetical protein
MLMTQFRVLRLSFGGRQDDAKDNRKHGSCAAWSRQPVETIITPPWIHVFADMSGPCRCPRSPDSWGCGEACRCRGPCRALQAKNPTLTRRKLLASQCPSPTITDREVLLAPRDRGYFCRTAPQRRSCAVIGVRQVLQRLTQTIIDEACGLNTAHVQTAKLYQKDPSL